MDADASATLILNEGAREKERDNEEEGVQGLLAFDGQQYGQPNLGGIHVSSHLSTIKFHK